MLFSCALRLHGPQHTRLPHFLKLMSIELVMPSNHLIMCHPLLLLPSIFPSIRVFSNELVIFTSGGQSTGASVSASVLPMIYLIFWAFLFLAKCSKKINSVFKLGHGYLKSIFINNIFQKWSDLYSKGRKSFRRNFILKLTEYKSVGYWQQ